MNRVAAEFGVEVCPGDGTSHWKYKRTGRRTGVITAHNGEREMIPDEYIKNMCRATGIDWKDFVRALTS